MPTPSLRLRSFGLVLLASLLTHCGKSASTISGGTTGACTAGSEGCACTTEGGCDAGLSCASSRCFDPSKGDGDLGDGDLGDGDSGDGDGDRGDGDLGDGDLGDGDLADGGAGAGENGDGDVPPIELGDGDGAMGGAGGWGRPGGGGCFFDENSGVDVCKCGKIGTWGELGSSSTGLVGGVDSLSAWLNLSSTLKADYTQAKPEITQEYLWQYDVLILQNLESWAPFTGPELEVFEAWLKSGGGLIALGGYAHDSQALAVANDLLFLTKMSFQSLSDTFASSPAECGHCYGNSVPQEGFLEHPIALYVTRVGAFHGHEVEPGDAVVVAEDPMEGVLGAAKDVGAGRAFLFHDEWVTYQEEWSGESIPAADSCRNDSQSACYGKGPGRDYQPAQFWYNALKWVLHERPCFALDDPSVVK